MPQIKTKQGFWRILSITCGERKRANFVFISILRDFPGMNLSNIDGKLTSQQEALLLSALSEGKTSAEKFLEMACVHFSHITV